MLRALQSAGEGEVETKTLSLEHGAGAMGLEQALLCQPDVLRPGEPVQAIPLALAVPDENQHIALALWLFVFLAPCHRLVRCLSPPKRTLLLVADNSGKAIRRILPLQAHFRGKDADLCMWASICQLVNKIGVDASVTS